MRTSSLVLPTGVLQVKQGMCGDRHRIVICTGANVAWPDEASVNGLRDDLLARVRGLKPDSNITMPMITRQSYNVLLVITLEPNVSESKATWFRHAASRVVYDNGRVLRVAKGSSPSVKGDKQKEPLVKRPPIRRAFAAA